MYLAVKQSIFNLLLLAATILLILGISLPMMTFEQFYIFENSISLLSALHELIGQAEWLLFWIILIFSIVFPVFKLGLLALIVNLADHKQHRRHFWLHWLAVLGKWSMLDVFVVALLLVSLKIDVIANVVIESGLYAFAGSVLMTMLITHFLHFTGKPENLN